MEEEKKEDKIVTCEVKIKDKETGEEKIKKGYNQEECKKLMDEE